MMQFTVLEVSQVIALHDYLIGKHEIQGMAKNKSLEAVLERVHNRVQYGFIADIFDLAACYATFIAKGNCFNDANKRTAAAALFFVLNVNEVAIDFLDVALGEWIVLEATNGKTEVDFAMWLRTLQARQAK
jgi:death-on-curing protein